MYYVLFFVVAIPTFCFALIFEGYRGLIIYLLITTLPVPLLYAIMPSTFIMILFGLIFFPLSVGAIAGSAVQAFRIMNEKSATKRSVEDKTPQ